MKKSKIEICPNLLDGIVGSQIMSETEKLHILKFVGYLTPNEQKKLSKLV